MPGVGFNLTQSLKQQQTLAPQMRQGLKMLQMTSLELSAELQHAMETNPVIEDVTNRIERQMSAELPEDHPYGEVTEKPLDLGTDAEMAKVMGTDATDAGYRDYFLGNMESASGDEEVQSRRDHLFDSMIKPETLQQYLMGQVGMSDIPPADRDLANILIENIDDDGYFRGSIPDIMMVTTASMEKIEGVLAQIRAFDPLGCGARDLRECLLLQLRGCERTEETVHAETILRDYFPDFASKHFQRIMSRMMIDKDQLRAAVVRISKLNPNPGGQVDDSYSEQAQQVVPDFVLDLGPDGSLNLSMPRFPLPEVKVKKKYSDILDAAKTTTDPKVKEAAVFVKQRVDSAKWFVEALKQRHNTLQTTMQTIIDFQHDYFIDGDESKLKPMVLKDIAALTGFDISTISRVVSSKYIETHFGIFPLKYFFSEGLENQEGEEVSTRGLKKALQELVDGEDKSKPLTDDQLVTEMEAKGFKVARRTIAKYRDQLGIAKARLRKELW